MTNTAFCARIDNSFWCDLDKLLVDVYSSCVVYYSRDFGIDINNAVRSAVEELLQGQRLDEEALKLELYPATELLNVDAVQAQLAVAYNMVGSMRQSSRILYALHVVLL